MDTESSSDFIKYILDICDIIYKYYKIYPSTAINLVNLFNHLETKLLFIACLKNQIDKVKKYICSYSVIYTNKIYKCAYLLAYEKQYIDIANLLLDIIKPSEKLNNELNV